MTCGDNLELSSGYCYVKCENGYSGLGNICFKDKCPSGQQKCGEFLCVENGFECIKEILVLTKKVLFFLRIL